MKQVEKLKLKRKLLTSAIGLSSILCMMPISTKEVYANEVEIESTNDQNFLIDIYYYCIVYNLKQEIVIDIFKKKTHNFNDYEWKKYNMIEYKMYDNKDLAILTTIKNINNNPELYGYKKEEIMANYTYVSTNTPEMMVEKYSKIYNIPSEIPISIMYSECGSDMSSHNYLVNNNPAGIGPHKYFENKEIGIIYFIDMLKNDYGCDSDSTNDFFKKVAKTYCENPEHWINMTNSFYNDITKQNKLTKNNNI